MSYLERGHSLKTKRTGRINAGLFTPEREAALEWINWFCDNHIPRSMQNEIADAHPDMIERMEYIRGLSEPTFSEKVAHYEKVLTSKTAKFEFPDGKPRFDTFPLAFDYCREANHPVTVFVKEEKWKLFPSGTGQKLTPTI